uniref:Uncharacterized protein n=1 Tax=Macrostomum lignano TaxID=282301 RepID=A0A1I8FJ51_9PLAT
MRYIRLPKRGRLMECSFNEKANGANEFLELPRRAGGLPRPLTAAVAPVYASRTVVDVMARQGRRGRSSTKRVELVPTRSAEQSRSLGGQCPAAEIPAPGRHGGRTMIGGQGAAREDSSLGSVACPATVQEAALRPGREATGNGDAVQLGVESI